MRPPHWLVACLALLAACSDSSGPDAVGGGSGAASSGTGTAPTTGPVADEAGSTSAGSTAATTGADGASTGSTTDDGQTGPAMTTGEVACPPTHRCAETVADWGGPLAVAFASAPGNALVCGGNFTTEVYRGQRGLSSGDHICACDCIAPNLASVTCGPTPLSVHSNSVCFSIPSVEANVGSNCLNVTDFSTTDYVFLDNGNISGGQQCATTDAGTTIDPAAFTEAMLACSATPLNSTECGDDEVCAPTPTPPFEGGLCVFAEGDRPCPEGADYTDRHVLYGDIDDGRTCQTCACGSATGTCTANQMFFFNNNTCAGNPVGSASGDGCSAAGPVDGYIVGSVLGGGADPNPGVDCAPLQGTNVPVGEVLPTEPVTVCCAAG